MSDDQHGTDGSTLSRRRFFEILAGTSVAAMGITYGTDPDRSLNAAAETDSPGQEASQYHVDVMTAMAEAVYPPSVSVERSFIENRVFGRVEPRPGHFENLYSTIDAVEETAKARFGGGIPEISPGRRREVLQSIGVTTVHPTPDGTTAERIRFYLVNDLLYALFTSPLGGDLIGIDNPPGYPGGREAYQRGPEGGEP